MDSLICDLATFVRKQLCLRAIVSKRWHREFSSLCCTHETLNQFEGCKTTSLVTVSDLAWNSRVILRHWVYPQDSSPRDVLPDDTFRVVTFPDVYPSFSFLNRFMLDRFTAISTVSVSYKKPSVMSALCAHIDLEIASQG